MCDQYLCIHVGVKNARIDVYTPSGWHQVSSSITMHPVLIWSLLLRLDTRAAGLISCLCPVLRLQVCAVTRLKSKHSNDRAIILAPCVIVQEESF